MNTMQYREANPLRKWRRRNNATQGFVASQIRKTIPLLSNWESGDVMPTGQSLALLAVVMGLSTESLKEAWNTWRETRPSIKRR